MTWVDELKGYEPAAITLPRFDLPTIDDAAERKAVAERIATTRIIRSGRDAWEQINKAESFDGWKAIGAALSIGKRHALRTTGANAAWGRNYGRAFSDWNKAHGFGTMPKGTRSWAIALHENAKAIEQWRQGLSEQRRKRLVNPQSVVKRWQKEMHHGDGKCPQDLKRDAVAAWKRFVSCVEMLPPDQAAPLWRAVAAEVAAHAQDGPQSCRPRIERVIDFIA
jgi:hypothetical protein